jgi:hypothetical protein
MWPQSSYFLFALSYKYKIVELCLLCRKLTLHVRHGLAHGLATLVANPWLAKQTEAGRGPSDCTTKQLGHDGSKKGTRDSGC